MAVEIFISYAHEDEAYLRDLKRYLKPLQDDGLIQTWYDADISGGADWRREIETHLNNAQVILLLISPDFMASDYVRSVEMKRALERHDRGEARVIPIILSTITRYAWDTAPFKNLQVLPRNAKPIRGSRDKAKAFVSVVDGIQEAIEELATRRTTPGPANILSITVNVVSRRKIFFNLVISISVASIVVISLLLVTHYSFPFASNINATATAVSNTNATAVSNTNATAVSNTNATATAATCPTKKTLDEIWQVTQGCGLLHINYNNGISSPEYGSLDLKSSYFRLNYGPASNWGTSIILLPVFWSQSACPAPGLCQGASVTVQPRIEGTDLILSVDGLIGNLHVLCVVRLTPPTQNAISAQVQTTLEGSIQLDTNRPYEAFKPVVLTSMHDSSTQWDTQRAYTDNGHFEIPSSGWILSSPMATHRFGLEGGTSSWKKNAPTLEVVLTQPTQMVVTGWVTQSHDPKDDNVAFWASSNTLLHAWNYTVKASDSL